MKKSLWLVLIAVLLGAAKAALDHELQWQLNQQLQRADGGVTYQHAYVALDASVVLEQLDIRHPSLPPLYVERLVLPQVYRFATGIPATLALEASGIRLSLPDATTDLAFLFKAVGYGDYYLNGKDLTRLGYARLTSDAHLRLAHDPTQQQLAIDVNLDNGNLGTWQVNLKLDNIAHFPPPQHWTALPLRLADISLREQAFLRRAAADLARRHQQPATELRQTLADKVRRDLEMMRFPLDAASLDALTALLRDDRPLHLQAAPPEPLPLLVLLRYLPLQWPALLGLRLETR